MSVVGATGHQRLPADALVFLRDRVAAYLRERLPLTGVCSLAVGADQLFAEALLDAGGCLEVVVPCDDYESTFETEESKDCFRRLLQRASSVESLPYSSPSEEAFLAAGRLVVDKSDTLIAIWNGQPARGRGGTGDVVQYARSTGKPVDVIWQRSTE